MIEKIPKWRSVAGIVFCLSLFACSVSKQKITRSFPLGGPAEISINTGWQLQDAAKVPDGANVISQTGYVPTGWYNATVPGTVLTSLVNDGVFAEPLYGENNRPDKIPESLCRTSYWYRTQFMVPNVYAGSSIWLNFHGINYIAEVWVNGHDLGAIKGAFSRGVFDISPYVKGGESAAVAVQIQPPPHPGNPHEHTASAGTGGNGGISRKTDPPFCAAWVGIGFHPSAIAISASGRR